jgi:hypothetical protein
LQPRIYRGAYPDIEGWRRIDFSSPGKATRKLDHKASDKIGVALAASIRFWQAKTLRYGNALHQRISD